MKTMILTAVLAVALMLAAGCGGGSKGGSVAGMPSVQTPTTPPPTVRVASLPVLGEPETPSEEPVVVEIPDNTVRITPGQTREVSVGGRSVSVRCPSGGASCHVGVHEGKLWYRLDGAVPFALASLPLPTPTPPTTPPTRVIEPPLVSWGELPALVDRMDHLTELRGTGFVGTSCDGGVTACQAAVKDLLAFAGESGSTPPVKWFSGRVPLPLRNRPSRPVSGGWLDNSIFIRYHAPSGEGNTAPYLYDTFGTQLLSMGIRDTNPVTGVYRGGVTRSSSLSPGSTFELRYTSNDTGGQLDMTILHLGSYGTWTNISVDNEGYFNHDATFTDGREGAKELEGRFYQGGEVGGVYSVSLDAGDGTLQSIYAEYGAFGGKLVPDTP